VIIKKTQAYRVFLLKQDKPVSTVAPLEPCSKSVTLTVLVTAKTPKMSLDGKFTHPVYI